MNNWIKATLIVFGNILCGFIISAGLIYFVINFTATAGIILATIFVGMTLTLMISNVKGDLDRKDLINRNRGNK